MTGTVIGCVWGAHRALTERHHSFPGYQWCERQWRDRLRKVAPSSNALPGWLETELWSAWRAENAQPRQLSLDLRDAS